MPGDPLKPASCVLPWTAGVALVAMALIIVVQVQDGAAYPYRIGMRATLAEAEAQVAYHPAVAAAHLALSAMMPADTPNKFSSAELYAAVVLDPNDPQARDLYASGLLLAGEKSAGLRQIALSVYHAPRRELHPYLSARSLPWLLPDEQMAIAQGFERAIGAGFDQALDQCTVFYTRLGRYRDLANLYVRVARTTPEGPQRMNREVTAGHNYALAGDSARATEILHEARETDPSDPAPYIDLVTSVIGPTGDFRAAQRTVDEGIQSGADPYSLELALASAAGKSGNLELYESALLRAIHYQPNFEDTAQLGEFYLTHNRFEPAILMLQKAIEMNPDSAAAFFDLGRAHEAAYDYSAAVKAYEQAIRLAPYSQSYRRTYEEFKQRLSDAARADRTLSASAVSP
jgi:tetratricopeptide (TPR) repeat protein